jgi:hypothetical protein
LEWGGGWGDVSGVILCSEVNVYSCFSHVFVTLSIFYTSDISSVHLTLNLDALLLSKINACICMFHTSVSSSLLYTLDKDSVELKSNHDGILVTNKCLFPYVSCFC